jgi:hypothetical protein
MMRGGGGDEDAHMEAPSSTQKPQQARLHSSQCGPNKREFYPTWGRGDHAEIMGTFLLGTRKKKDWVFATEDFLSQASDVIRDVLLDHDKEYRCKSYVDREASVNNRKPGEYDMDLEVIEKGKGIFHSHILLVTYH